MTTALHNVDPALIDGMTPPTSFIESCYSPQELMERVGLTNEQAFWWAYREGRLPRGVSLPCDPPMLCWDRRLIEEWIAAGSPRDEVHAAHEHVVLSRLLDTVRDTLSAFPPTASERN